MFENSFLVETNISPTKARLKMIILFPFGGICFLVSLEGKYNLLCSPFV